MKLFHYFSVSEKILWCSSTLLVLVSFFIFDGEHYSMLAASLIGAAYLIFNAKGNPFGQVLLIVFSILYGIISYSFAYYGEMVTYLGMSTPMAIFSLIAWLKNPYHGNRAEVRVNRLHFRESLFMFMLTAAVTIMFYFILRYFQTANLLPSTLSVFTSFLAVYLTLRRSKYFALAYAANDIVLILLWILASLEDLSYLSVVICFAMFLVNDIYAYFNWCRMERRQEALAE